MAVSEPHVVMFIGKVRLLSMDFNYQWNLLQLMNGPLVAHSVLEWLRNNFITAQHPFIEPDALLQWSMQDITLLFSIILKTIPITQSDFLRENVLMGDIKKVFFSAVTILQQVRTTLSCPYPMQPYQKKNYVVTPLVQMMREAVRDNACKLWSYQPVALAAQLLMPVTPHSLGSIKHFKLYVDLKDCKSLVNIPRLVKACEDKYVMLFNPTLKGVWEEMVDTTRKQAKAMTLTTSDPNIWATALWYFETSTGFHKIMQKLLLTEQWTR